MKFSKKIQILIWLAFTVFVSTGLAKNSGPEHSEWFIPDNVIYIHGDAQQVEEDRKALLKTFSEHKKNLYKLAKKQSGYFFLGPLLSARLQDTSPGEVAELSSAGYRVKISEGFEPRFNGVLAKTNKEKKLLSKLLSDRIGDSLKINIRRLNPDELAFMWYFISWDIKEPVFVLETDDHTFLVDVGAVSEDQLWIEEISNPCYQFGFDEIISPCLCFEVLMEGQNWSAGFTEKPQQCLAGAGKQVSLVKTPDSENTLQVEMVEVQLLNEAHLIEKNISVQVLADWMDKVKVALNKSVTAGQKGQIAIDVTLKVQGDSDYNLMYQERVDESWLLTVREIMDELEYIKPMTDDIKFVMIFDVDTE